MGKKYVNDRNLFIVASSTAFLPKRLPIRGYAGHTGRMDVIIRSIIACAGGDYSFYGLLCGRENDGVCPAIIVDDCSRLPLDIGEHELVSKLVKGDSAILDVEPVSIEHLAWSLSKKDYRFVLLEETGRGLCQRSVVGILGSGAALAFLLGGHLGFPEVILRVFRRYRILRVNVGPYSFHTSNVVLLLRYVLDVGLQGFCEGLKAPVERDYNGEPEEYSVK